MNPLMHSGVIPGACPGPGFGYVQDGYGMLQQTSPNTGDVMACSPYSHGSNSTSPPSHHSPRQYPAVKSEPIHTGLQMAGPHLQILEQPQERFRFRYESELGGTHGQLAGRSGADRRSFPTVKLEGFSQKALIRCELFTVEESGSNMQPVPHVHTLQGRNCSGGYAETRVDHENDFTASFQGLGIIHTAKKQMVDKIMTRKLDEKKMEMERINMGRLWNPAEADRLEAREQANRESQRINMNRVCLRFRALYQNVNNMRYEEICQPVYSGPIFNGKSAQTGELKIVQLSEAFSPCTGQKEIWLLVERVRKNDIKVLVYEEDMNHQQVWSDYGRVIKCHHQYAIIFQTPPYRNREIRSPVRVFIQLERPSDGCVSEPKHFQYTERDQRTTKRTIQPETGGASESKRFFLESEQGRTPFDMPNMNTLKNVPAVVKLMNSQMTSQHPQHATQQHQLHHLQQQLQQQRQQQPPQLQQQSQQQQQPQQQQQLPHSLSGMHTQAAFYPMAGHSPMAPTPYSPESVNTNSPTMMTEVFSPPHPSCQMTSPNGGRQSVDDVLGQCDMPQDQLYMPVTTASSVNEMNQQAEFLTMQHPQMQLDLPSAMFPGGLQDHRQDEGTRPLTDEQLQTLANMIPAGCLEDGIPNDPNRLNRAPRGVKRGFGGPAAASDASPPAGAASGPPAAGRQPSGDQLADDLGRMSLGGGGGGQGGGPGGGQGGPPEGPHGEQKELPRAADTSRPEVQLAYRNADSLYLFAATGDGNFLLQRFRCLVGMENAEGDNVLHVAAMYGNSKTLSCLLETISGLSEERRHAMIDSHNNKGQTPLHVAVLLGDLACVEIFLEAGAQCHLVDDCGNTALHLAVQSERSLAVLPALISHLDKQGQTARVLEQTNYRGLSALHLAARSGRRQAAQLLCAAGAAVSAPDDTEGRSPLHLAVEARDAAMCCLLIKLGATVDALTFADVTPLHLACKLGDHRLVSLFISEGADPRLQSVERQPAAGSGTESGEDEREDRDGAGGEKEEQEEPLDAFLYAEMAGDPRLEQILLGLLLVPLEEDDDEEDHQQQQQQQQHQLQQQQQQLVPPAAAAAAVAKKMDPMDSGMDSGLCITQELSSTCDLTSGPQAAGRLGGSECDGGGDVLPESLVRRLTALLDGPWRDVAKLLDLDVATVQDQPSPTVYILQCIQKYGVTLDHLSGVLEVLCLTDAQRVVQEYIGR